MKGENKMKKQIELKEKLEELSELFEENYCLFKRATLDFYENLKTADKIEIVRLGDEEFPEIVEEIIKVVGIDEDSWDGLTNQN